MSSLRVFADDQPDEPFLSTADPERIAALLARHGVRFERWAARAALAPGASQDEVLAAYDIDVKRIMAEGGYQTADVVGLTPDHPNKVALRQKFIDEHQHSEDEVRFFVSGHGMFYLHLDSKVFMLHCSKGDLLSVPAGTPHWFDMGGEPDFMCIRLFSDPAGWVATYTGSDIAGRFPGMDG